MEFFRQTSSYTGAAASMLMALHAHAPDAYPLDREHEFLIWMRSANLPTRSSSIYGLAIIAHDAGISATVVVGEQEYDYPDYRFKRYKKIEIDDAKFASKIYARTARKQGVDIQEREFDLAEVKKYLQEGKLILLRVNAGVFREKKAVSKYVLLRGFAQDQYIIMDPNQGEIHIDENTMQEAFNTLVSKKKRDHRMLILH